MTGRTTRSSKTKTQQPSIISQLRRSSVPSLSVAQEEELDKIRPKGMASGEDFTSVLNKIYEKLDGLSK